MRKLGILAFGACLLSCATAMAGSADDAADMIKQLAPSDAAATPETAASDAAIITVQAASRDEIVNRLGAPMRSLGPVSLPPPREGQ